jgi:hypothetical protein
VRLSRRSQGLEELDDEWPFEEVMRLFDKTSVGRPGVITQAVIP